MEKIEQEYMADEIDYMMAIEAVQELGYSSKDAEEIVSEWEDQKRRDDV